MSCNRWRGVILLIALLSAWPVREGVGWAADLHSLLSGLEDKRIASTSNTGEALGNTTTRERTNSERQSSAAEKGDTAAGNRPNETPGIEQGDTLVIAEVKVTERREAIEVDPVRSRTTVTAKELERRQSDNVFNVLQDIPGVSVDGGPLASGMKFNIRGMGDTEDVLIKLDGATRNFEKYRFGSGVFIEPELLKSIEVTRGPAGALQGSGAIGGVVEMRTKDATDFLQPGQRAGARLKAGVASNNEEKVGSASLYGVAFDSLELLTNLTWRESGNITTASGKKLQNTHANRLSGLAKATYRARAGAAITFAAVHFQEDTLQPFDATIGIPGLFGFVRRAVVDTTPTANFEYTPAAQTLSPWINLRGTFGYTSTSVTDSDRQGATGVPIPNSPTNFFDYRIATLDLTNTTVLHFGPVRNALTYGAQYNHNSRTAKTNQVINSTTGARNTVDNLSQPSGDRSNFAYIIENRLHIGDLSLTGGLRHDKYQVEVTAQSTRDALEMEGRSPLIEFAKTMPSAGIAWNMLGGPLTLFYNYAEAFRPPLVDEFFTQGPFSRCASFLMGGIAPSSQVCGNLYVPQSSVNNEVGVSLNYPGLFTSGDALTAKVVFFHNRVTNTLESISARTASGALCKPMPVIVGGNNDICTSITQDGKENREGVEFELGFRTEPWFSNLSIAAIRGKQVCDGERDLYTIPGNTLVFTLGRSDFGNKFEYGYRLRAVGRRQVVTGNAQQTVTPCNTGLTIGTQDGYVLHNLFAAYQPTKMLSLNLAVDNFTNTQYFLNNGFGGGIGQEAPGYNVRFSATVSF